MEQKKSTHADLESKRLTGFLIGMVVALSLLLAALEYTTTDGSDGSSYTPDDIAQEMETLPAPDRSDMIAAVEPQAKKAATEKLNIVDKKTQMEKLNDITQMRTVGDGDAAAAATSGNDDGKAEQLQPVAVDMGDNPLNFRIVEQLPEFPGGMSAFVKWLSDNLRYPPIAQRQNIQGRVVITFIVNRDGTTSDLKIATPAHPMLNREAMRVARMMPKWKPGIANNKPCRTMMAIPIEFKL